MRHFKPVLLLIPVALLLAGCGADGLYSLTLISAGRHELARDLPGDLILLGGEATLVEGAAVAGNVHVLLGDLTVHGEVKGAISFLNGHLNLGPTARIGGDLNLGSSMYSSSAGAIIEGDVNTGAGVTLPTATERGSPRGRASLLRGAISGVLLGLAAAALARYRPVGVRRVGEAAVQHPVVSGAMGALVGVVGVSLLVTMAYTIVLIPVSLLGLAALGLTVIYGWLGLGVGIGRLAGRALRRPLRPAVAAFIGTFTVILGVTLAGAIPIIGGLLAIGMASVGLGAAALTRLGLRRFTPAEAGVS